MHGSLKHHLRQSTSRRRPSASMPAYIMMQASTAGQAGPARSRASTRPPTCSVPRPASCRRSSAALHSEPPTRVPTAMAHSAAEEAKSTRGRYGARRVTLPPCAAATCSSCPASALTLAAASVRLRPSPALALADITTQPAGVLNFGRSGGAGVNAPCASTSSAAEHKAIERQLRQASPDWLSKSSM